MKFNNSPYLITDQMKFEAEEPSHGAFASLGYSFESLVYVYTLVAAYPKWCAVHKADSRALAQKHLLNKYCQRYGHLMLKFDKTVIGDYFGEQMPQVFTHMLQVNNPSAIVELFTANLAFSKKSVFCYLTHLTILVYSYVSIRYMQ